MEGCLKDGIRIFSYLKEKFVQIFNICNILKYILKGLKVKYKEKYQHKILMNNYIFFIQKRIL